MKFARKLGREAVPEWASKYVAYKHLKQAVEERSERFLFLYDREAEKVCSFYAQHAAFLTSRIASIESIAQGGHADPAALVEKAEALSLEVRRLTHYCGLNMEGLHKILRKYDRLHAESNLTAANYPPRPAADTQFTIADYHRHMSALRTRLSLVISAQATRSKLTGTAFELDKEKDTVDMVWGTIYELRKHAVFERDDATALVERVPDLAHIMKLSRDLEDGACRLSVREECLLFKVLVESACRHGAFACLRLMIDAGLAVSDYEAHTGTSLIHVTLSKRDSSTTAIFRGEDHLIDKPLQPGAYSAVISILLAHGASLEFLDDQQRTVFHIAAIAPGTQHAAVLRLLLANCHIGGQSSKGIAPSLNENDIIGSDESLCNKRPLFARGDSNGCTPLFYAIEGGCIDKVAALYERFDSFTGLMAENSQLACQISGLAIADGSVSASAPSRFDSSPASKILDPQVWDPNEPDLVVDAIGRALWTPVLLAARMGHAGLIRYLAGRGVNLDAARAYGEPPLYVCAKANNEACLTALLECGANVDAREVFSGMTALCAAASGGCDQCVSILLEHYADIDAADDDGWTAHEHAVYHGHLRLARKLEGPKHREYAEKYESQPCPPDIGTWATMASPLSAAGDDLGSAPQNSEVNVASSTASVVTTEREGGREYGHRYVGDHATLLATLISVDVALHQTPLELKLSLSNSPGISHSLQLPMNAPDGSFWEEHTLILDLPSALESVSGSSVLIDLQRMGPLGALETVARGAIPLSSIVASSQCGMNCPSLTHFVTMLGHPDFAHIGTFQLRILLATPLNNAELIRNIEKRPAYWKSVASRELVIGHRGIGSDTSALTARRLQIRENTVLSIIVAASLGAEYVEFDVQLTRDNVPVLYHDFIVSEAGAPVGVSSLSLDELRKITRDTRKRATEAAFSSVLSASRARDQNSRKSSVQERQSVRFSVHGDFSTDSSVPISLASRDSHVSRSQPTLDSTSERSREGGSSHDDKCASAENLASDAPLLRPKSSASYHSSERAAGNLPFVIDSPFCTLAEAFREAPSDLGFNIELKYPTSAEVAAESIPHVPDINAYCDRVLEVVFEHAGERNIMFSSFHPDICVLMSLKQPTFPVFFLTCGSDASNMLDYRMTSLHSAVTFAENSHLLGIVCDAAAVVAAPRIISKVKERGLLLFTYGEANNDVGKVRLQRSHGVDAVIVDAVAHVRKGLLDSRNQCID